MRTPAHRPAIDHGAQWGATTTMLHRRRVCRCRTSTTTRRLRPARQKMPRLCSSMRTASDHPRSRWRRRDHRRRNLQSSFMQTVTRPIARRGLLYRHHPQPWAGRRQLWARRLQQWAKHSQLLARHRRLWAGRSLRASSCMRIRHRKCDPRR